jgi:butyrate kinase
MKQERILAINPGSTSTKIAVYEGTKNIFLKTLRHSSEELVDFAKITDQFAFRKNIILKELETAGIDISSIRVIVGRGGLIKPIPSGVYEVNEKMEADLKIGIMGEHASNLGGLIAADISRTLEGARAFIADPVVVDELNEVARVAGHPLFERASIFHALNQKAVARSYAKSLNKKYDELNLIVAHLGGGISVGAHQKGKVIDVNNALDGEGPFSPERSGTLPVGQLAKLCFEGNHSLEEIKKMITGKGGYVAYLNTNSAYDVELAAREGDKKATLIQNAMAYQVGKEIGAMAAVLKGQVDGIILTGGIAHNAYFVNYIKEMVEHLGNIIVYPGEDEMEALAINGLMVLRGETTPLVYE